MRSLWIVVAASLAVSSAIPVNVPTLTALLPAALPKTAGVSTRNSMFEQLLRDAIESLRDLVENGSGVIPPLDPLQIASLTIDDSVIPLPGANVDLRGLTVSNLGTFVIDDLSVQSLLLLRYRIIIEARIPELDLTADFYDLFITALGFNIFGSGEAKLKIINPRININIVVAPRFSIQGVYLNLVQTNIQFGLAEFKPEFTGLFGHEGASDFANKFLEDLVPNIVKAYETEINDFLSTTVHDILGPILADIDVGDLISPRALDSPPASPLMYS